MTRIIVYKKPNEDEVRCEYCNKNIKAKIYKNHLKRIHEIGIVEKKVMGMNATLDIELLIKQNEFENKLKAVCPFCKKEIIKNNLKEHFKEHNDVDADAITIALRDKNIRIVCPLCRTQTTRRLRYHLRGHHYMKLHTFAKGIYETQKTIDRRLSERTSREIIDIYDAGLIVQGGAYGLGKKH